MGACRGCVQTHRTGKKKTKSEKKKERQTHRFEPPQNYRPPQALRVSCMREASVRACREGREGGVAMTAQRQRRERLWWRDSVAGAEGGIHVTAWALRILGVRARREARARGLSGEGSGAHELRGKKGKKKSPTQTHTKKRPPRHVVHALLTHRQGVCRRQLMRPVRMRLRWPQFGL